MEPFFFEKIFCFVENGVNGPFWGPKATFEFSVAREFCSLDFSETVPDERR